MNENHCVCCGAVIPEGGQVCKQCEKKYEIKWGDSIIQAVYRKGFKDGQEILTTYFKRIARNNASGFTVCPHCNTQIPIVTEDYFHEET